jgi:hypothetical protein
MDNKVGDNVPKQKKLDALLAQLGANIEELRAFCVNLTDDERRQLLHPRRGAEPMVEKAYALTKRYGITVPNVPAEGMMNDLRLARQMRPFVTMLEGALKLVGDTSAQAHSEYWEAFLALYGAIQRAAEHDPKLEAESAEIVEFMREYARKRKKAAPAPSPEPKTP